MGYDYVDLGLRRATTVLRRANTFVVVVARILK